MSATATGGHERGIDARRRASRVPARLLRLASDERLVEALRGGSTAAFEVMYTRHHRGVLSFCRHMLGSVEEAEDAVQHTFLAAYRDLLRSDKPIRLRPWLYTIARNRCLSVLRARRERAQEELVEPSTEHLAHEVERRHDLRMLLGDVAALAPDQRAALVLAELGDMSHDDIGDVLGCPKEKVKALVFQARSSLIASRTARETSCAEIREQLANLRGGSLRRNTLKRHLRECPGCRDYRDQVLAQRSALALILPVAPSLGLKATVLGAAGVTAAAGGSASVAATAVVALCVAGGGTAAVDIARDADGTRPAPREPGPARVMPAAAAPEALAVERSAVPKTRRGSGPSDRGRPGRHKAKRRRGNRERGAAMAPPVGGQKVKARGKGANPEAARPVRAKGPKPKAARPVRARGPKLKDEKVRGPKPKADKARGPEPKAGKVRGPRPKAEEPAGPRSTPDEQPQPADAAGPPGKSKRG